MPRATVIMILAVAPAPGPAVPSCSVGGVPFKLHHGFVGVGIPSMSGDVFRQESGDRSDIFVELGTERHVTIGVNRCSVYGVCILMAEKKGHDELFLLGWYG